MMDPVYSLVFTTAFLGSGHCIGMCGPVVAALSLARPEKGRGIVFHLFYNCGRLITYVFIGIVAGLIGSLLIKIQTFSFLSRAILLLADLFVIMIGLRTTGMFKQLSFIHLELPGPGGILTRTVSRLHTFPTATAALSAGLLMGFLPCGFLYAIALAAAGSASAIKGGMIMLAFGLGTLPALFLFGTAFHWLSGSIRGELLRWAGIMVVVLGGYNLYNHIRLSG